jgi:sterol desaturase/sphingolipid hydroxylase (fatty acid hydroxylase superfamily)
MNYDWQAGVALLGTWLALTIVGRKIAFSIPAVARMREWNHREDAERLAKAKYPPIVKQNRLIGAVVYGLFFFVVAPFFVHLERVALWKPLLDIAAVLMVYDFFYYLMHRFLFHGPILLKIHALHHQARDPSHIDSAYVHPVETMMGTALFLGTVLGMTAVLGNYNAFTLGVLFWIWVELNTVNHTKFDLPQFPFGTLNWLIRKHHVHHINMGMGNYATITMLYDRVFGTLD